MKLVEFTRVLPGGTVPWSVNPEHIVWVQSCDQYSTLIMLVNGPEVEVQHSYNNVNTVLRGAK